MRKKLFRALTLTLALALTLQLSALAAGMGNFRPSGSGTVSFTDLPAGHWAAPWAGLCASYGLMTGTGGGAFSPDGTLSAAEAVVMADRVHQTYTGGESTLANGNPWYQPYVDYAQENGLLDECTFSDYTAPISRAQMAQLLCNALPSKELEAINDLQGLPDLEPSHPNAQAIYTLYEAGVLTGSDAYGTFHPESSITRAEAAAILARLALPDQRQQVLFLQELTVSANDGTTVLAFPFPQNAEVSADGSEYDYQGEDFVLHAALTTVYEPSILGLGVWDVYTPDMVSAQLAEAFGDLPYATVPVRMGDVEGYLTSELPEAQAGADMVLNVSFLSFFYQGNMVVLGLLGANCPDRFQSLLDGITVLGSPIVKV